MFNQDKTVKRCPNWNSVYIDQSFLLTQWQNRGKYLSFRKRIPNNLNNIKLISAERKTQKKTEVWIRINVHNRHKTHWWLLFSIFPHRLLYSALFQTTSLDSKLSPWRQAVTRHTPSGGNDGADALPYYINTRSPSLFTHTLCLRRTRVKCTDLIRPLITSPYLEAYLNHFFSPERSHPSKIKSVHFTSCVHRT